MIGLGEKMKEQIKQIPIELLPHINGYLERRAQDVSEMIHALKAQDYQTIKSTSHKIIGSAKTWGFENIGNLVKKLEHSADTEDDKLILKNLLEIKSKIEEITENLINE